MASYDKLNAQNLTEILAASPNSQQQAWAELIVKKSNDYSVLYDNFVGKPGSGKPFVEHSDMSVVAGNTVNIPMLGSTRGPGRQGSGDREGREKKLVPKDFSFKVGRWWDGFAINSVALNETVIGAKWDKASSMYLRKNLGIKKTDDMMMELVIRATSRNTVRPNNKASRDSLRTSDVFSTNTIIRGQSILTSLGAKVAFLGQSSAGHPIRRYTFLSTQFGLESFRTSQTYLDGITNADVRGEMNALFTGNILPWQGNPVYQWDIEDPDDIAPAGCPLLPRAFVGEAIAGGTGAFTVKGGSNAQAAADTDVQFFGYFSNSEYIGCEGRKVAADATTERYLGIQILSGANAGKVAYIAYKVNNGNQITGLKRLGSTASGTVATTVGNIAWGSGAYGSNAVALLDTGTDAIPEGSLVQEVNSYGVPFCRSFGLGEMAGVMGHGSIDGRGAVGKRTEEHRNHDMDHAIGIETVFGSRAVERIDGQPGGYVLIESALALPGWPILNS